FDAYAKEKLTKFVDVLGIDGLDFDMETRPSEKDIVLSNGVIRALSQYIGPKSGTDRPFLYVSNAEYLPPLQHVSDCFDFHPYQQYG
ncbi:EndoS/ChiA family endoglycosidase, partial [Enterococcus faecalis]|uniref:EndoS/ChiA family endoglycosidase n=1 Tax=Enterococcus faecalis TaxID=1351 RepID=UPI003CC6CAF0